MILPLSPLLSGLPLSGLPLSGLPLSGLLLGALLTAPARAEVPAQQGLLLCPDPRTCEEDRSWVQQVGGGGPGGFAVVDFEQGFAPDGVSDSVADREAFQAALADAREAADANHWGNALDAANRGLAALGRWRGAVKTQELFDLYVLRGIAGSELGRDASYAYSFRQALAVADGRKLPAPAMPTATQERWLDEERKLTVGGRGSLLLQGGPAGTRWMIDGSSVESGLHELWPGNHRVTATAPGVVRSWTAEVPVLPDRTSEVAPAISNVDEAAWVLAALQDAVATLDAPDDVKDLLVAWCRVHDIDELRLMKVEEVVQTLPPAPLELSAAPGDRPAAAAGEPVDMGDGVPTTYEGEVLQRYTARGEQHVTRLSRLRLAFFDPDTRRFSADTAVSSALAPSPERLRLGVHTAWVSMMDRQHLGADVQLVVPMGPVALDARLGVVRADQPYNLYKDWVDRALTHVYVGARWAPSWTVAPFVGVGTDVYAPAALGGRLTVGGQARFARTWLFEVEADGDLLTTGLATSAGLGLAHGF